MSVDDEIARSRGARLLRNRRSIALGSFVLLSVLAALAVLPKGSPLQPLVFLFVAAFVTGVTLYEQPDEFQRKLALIAFSIGAATGLTWTIVQAVRQALNAHYVPQPGQTIGLTGSAWAIAWGVQQVRIDRGRRQADSQSPDDGT